MNEYTELVLTLHNIAREIEKKFGSCQISEDIRKCADKLHTLGEPLKVKE